MLTTPGIDLVIGTYCKKINWEKLIKSSKPSCCFVMFASYEKYVELILSNTKMYKYEWILTNKDSHSYAVIFYDKMPIYNPQKVKGRVYTNYRKRADATKTIASGMSEPKVKINDGMMYPKTVINIKNPVDFFKKTYSNSDSVILEL